MRQILIDAMKLGIGTLDLTHEQVEKFVKKAQKQYGTEIKDGRKMVNELLAQANRNQQSVQQRIQREVKDSMHKQKLVHEDDLKAFQKQAKALATTSARMAKSAGTAVAAEVSRRVADQRKKSAAKKRAAKRSSAKRPAKKTRTVSVRKKSAKKPARAKKSSKRPAKKAAKKSSRRASKKAPAKRAAKKSSRKKPAKKVSKKSSKRSAKKAAKNTSRKPARKAARKTSRRSKR